MTAALFDEALGQGLLRHVLRHGDRALVLAQRLGEWIAHAPELEQDMAFANISLDLIGQARRLYGYAGRLEDAGHDEDHFAYWRGHEDFMNPQLVEQPNGDFAQSMARQFLHDAYAVAYWEAMTASTDDELAALAARARTETSFHLRHSRVWLVRLGDGTAESRAKMQRGLDAMWPFTAELGPIGDEAPLREAGLVCDGGVRESWEACVGAAVAESTLDLPEHQQPQPRRSHGIAQSDLRSEEQNGLKGGWHGVHSPELKALLDELQSVARAHPGASW